MSFGKWNVTTLSLAHNLAQFDRGPVLAECVTIDDQIGDNPEALGFQSAEEIGWVEDF